MFLQERAAVVTRRGRRGRTTPVWVMNVRTSLKDAAFQGTSHAA